MAEHLEDEEIAVLLCAFAAAATYVYSVVPVPRNPYSVVRRLDWDGGCWWHHRQPPPLLLHRLRELVHNMIWRLASASGEPSALRESYGAISMPKIAFRKRKVGCGGGSVRGRPSRELLQSSAAG